MEIHPILEVDTAPSGGLWYVVSGFGDSPSMRVGHTCSYVPSNEGRGKIYLMGGANPDGPFKDIYILDLDTFSWDICDTEGLKGRYEHAMFIPETQPRKIYIYGGAEQNGNLGDMQVYDIDSKKWENVEMKGTKPSPRTYHSCSCVGDKFYVFSGGQSGSEPVTDRNLHCFDIKTHTWSKVVTQGDTPKARHGHVVAVVNNKLIVHGGMSRTSFFDDLHVLDLKTLTWKYIRNRGVFPSKRTAHNSCVYGQYLYIFGGMNNDGALDDTYRLDTETMKWTKLNLDGPPPACRLDFAGCFAPLRVEIAKEGSENPASSQQQNGLDRQLEDMTLQSTATNENDEAAEADGATAANDDRKEEVKVVPMWLINGGMDTQGNIFDDTLVLVLE